MIPRLKQGALTSVIPHHKKKQGALTSGDLSRSPFLRRIMNSSIEQLKLYTIDDAFIKDLHDNIDSRVFNNNDPAYNHARKYLGVLIKIGSFSYYAPLSSPKRTVICHAFMIA